MVKVNFRTSDFRRQVAGAGDLILKNRYFEENPFLTDDGAALLARPGMRRLKHLGSGPIRGIHSEAGAFNGDLFVASGAEMYRMDSNLNATSIYTNLYNPGKGFVNMAITAAIGTTPEYLFFADGRNLYVYVENGYANGALTGSIADNDVICIDTMYYQVTSSPLDEGNPAGTSSNPWRVALGTVPTDAFENLYNAVNGTGVPGTDYSTDLEKNLFVRATNYSANLMHVRAVEAGAVGNAIVTTTTGTGNSWTNGDRLTGGGEPYVQQVFMPDDVGVTDVAVVSSFVIVIPTQTDGYQGKFYWIDPGEIFVDPLNFATAESSPDGVYGVEVLGDQFWLPGESTTEVWYPTGDAATPMRRLQGVVLDRGSWQNTAQAVHESMVIVDADGGVFLVRGGTPQRVSTPDIEEEIRNAISLQQGYLY